VAEQPATLLPWCSRQGALTRECKSPTNPTGGIVSWTARVSIVRWNLKEATGKTLVGRTEIACEACKLDEEANIFKVQHLYGKLVYMRGNKARKVRADYPRRSVSLCHALTASRGDRKSWQKSVDPGPD